MTSAAEADARSGHAYDGGTIALHWATVALVALLFGMAQWWQYTPHAIRFRFELEDAHVSVGIALAAVLAARLVWRLVNRRAYARRDGSVVEALSRVVHALLYLLLVAQVTLGVVLSGLQGKELSFFGLFSVPGIVGRNRELAEQVIGIHNLSAWTLVIVACGHAAMALIHHYLLRDDVLARMLPLLRRQRGA